MVEGVNSPHQLVSSTIGSIDGCNANVRSLIVYGGSACSLLPLLEKTDTHDGQL